MSLTIRNAPLAWFQRVLWLGIAANVALAVPTLLIPERMLALFSVSYTHLTLPTILLV